MNELEMIRKKTIPTDKLGALQIMATLIYYDYPRAFIVYSDSSKEYYVLIENDDSQEHFEWISSSCTLEQINKVNLGLANIQSLFDDGRKVIFSGCSDSDTVKTEFVVSFDEDHKLSGDFMAPGFCDMDEVFDFHGLRKISQKDNAIVMSLVFEGDGRVPTDAFISSLNSLHSNFSLFDIKCSNSYIQVASGSTVVSLIFENVYKGPIFDPRTKDLKTEEAVERFRSCIESDDSSELLNFSGSDSEKKLKHFKTFTKKMGESTSVNPKMVFAYPDPNRKTKSISFNAQAREKKDRLISDTQKAIKAGIHTAQTEQIEKGTLQGCIKEGKGAFRFKLLSSDEIISGTVSYELNLEGIVLVNKVYEATFLVIDTYNSDNTKVKPSQYHMIRLTPLEGYELSKQLTLPDM